jgi:hypothetical protein
LHRAVEVPANGDLEDVLGAVGDVLEREGAGHTASTEVR